MSNKRKNFRLDAYTEHCLDELKAESGRNHTQLIDAAIQYVHLEYLRAKKGIDHDSLIMCHVLGKPIEAVELDRLQECENI